jgi:hypothetical protein
MKVISMPPTVRCKLICIAAASLLLTLLPAGANDYLLFAVDSTSDKVVKIDKETGVISDFANLPFDAGFVGFDYRKADGKLCISKWTESGIRFYSIDPYSGEVLLSDKILTDIPDNASIGFTDSGDLYLYYERNAFQTGDLVYVDWSTMSATPRSIGSRSPSVLGGDYDQSRNVFWVSDEWDGKVYHLNAQTGDRMWTSSSSWFGGLTGDMLDMDVTPSGEILVIAQGPYGDASYSKQILTVNPTNGTWTTKLVLDPNTPIDTLASVPLGDDTDNDGVNNYREDKDGTNPSDPTSFNPLSKGLVAYYPLKNSYLDESGLDNDLKDPTAGISFSYDRFGKPANSLSLASAQDRIISHKKTGITGDQPHSISLWFYVDQTPNWNMRYLGTLLIIRDPQSSAIVGAEHRILLNNADGKTRVISHGGYSDFHIEVAENSLDKQWHHLLVVYRGELTTSSIFIDGHLVTPNIIDPRFSSVRNLVDGLIYLGSSPLPDGSNADGTSNAHISDVRIYNRSLSDGEVRTLYYSESLTAAHRHFVESNPDLLGHYSKADYNANRTNGQIDVTSNPSAFNLFTQAQFDGSRTAGQSDVINNPMSYGLYTSDSIMDLRMGGLMIQRNGDNAVVSFQPQTTTDLSLPFTNNGTPITNTIPMHGNKGFIRINAKP